MLDTILHTAEGMAAGVIGTKIIDLELAQAGKLPEKLRPTQPKEHPGSFLARKLGRGRLDEKQLEKAGHALHWAYGVGWAAALGLVSEKLGMRSLGRALVVGTGFGALVWLAGYAGWLPMAKLTRPLHRTRPASSLSGLLGHIGYGLATALPLWGMRVVEDKLR